jgi:hypothetical protein
MINKNVCYDVNQIQYGNYRHIKYGFPHFILKLGDNILLLSPLVLLFCYSCCSWSINTESDCSN